MLYYAGIGSRQTPDDVLDQMASIAKQLADKWTLRSGFAKGADQAFAYGVERANGEMMNYLPWEGYNGAPHNDDRFMLIKPTEQMAAIAAEHHPAWRACSDAARLMHTRNVAQVLGHDLVAHSKMVICWTPNGSGSGGTGQAIRIARAYGIPVFDLAIEAHKQMLCDYVEQVELFDTPSPVHQHEITVVNKHHGKSGEYIGRGSPLGNIYTHLESKFPNVIKVKDRKEAIAKYREWLRDMLEKEYPDVVNEMSRLYLLSLAGPMNLKCTCKPAACHGDVIREELLRMHNHKG